MVQTLQYKVAVLWLMILMLLVSFQVMRLTIIAAGTSNNDLIFAAGFFSGNEINNYNCRYQ
jgi:hypothetical protein